MDAGVDLAHFLEVMCALLGEVQSVGAVCVPVICNMAPDPRVDDVSSVSLLFAGGPVGVEQVKRLRTCTMPPASSAAIIRSANLPFSA